MLNKARNHCGLTFEEGADFPDSQGSQAGELAQGELKKEEGDAADGQHEEVRNKEGPCREVADGGGSQANPPSKAPQQLPTIHLWWMEHVSQESLRPGELVGIYTFL